jgi:serine/threonine protein kinase
MESKSLDECVKIVQAFMQLDNNTDETGRIICEAGYFGLVETILGISTREIQLPVTDKSDLDGHTRALMREWASTVEAYLDHETPVLQELVNMHEKYSGTVYQIAVVSHVLSTIKNRFNGNRRIGKYELSAEIENHIKYLNQINQPLRTLPPCPELIDKARTYLLGLEEDKLVALKEFILLAAKARFAKDEMFAEKAGRLHDNPRAVELLKRELDESVKDEYKCKTFSELCEVAELKLPDYLMPMQRLGSGNVGRVYRAKNTFLDTEVAVKVVDGISTTAKRASAETIPGLWNVPSPYVLKHHMAFPHSGQTIVVMELFDKTLEQRIKEAGKLPFSEVMCYFEQILEGLSACQKANIVHPDLAPHNMGISNGRIKLSDFNESLYPSTGELKYGGIDYASPERFDFNLVTKNGNIWSVGVILYEMLTGKKLFSPQDINKKEHRREYRQQVINAQKSFKSEELKNLIEKIQISEEEAKEYLTPKFSNLFEAASSSLPPPSLELYGGERPPANYVEAVRSILDKTFSHCFADFTVNVFAQADKKVWGNVDLNSADGLKWIYYSLKQELSNYFSKKERFKGDTSPPKSP